jgi:uncharacterized protein (DUF2336 family)
MNDTMTRAGIASEQDVKEINAVAVRRPDLEADPRGIVRRFLAWTQRADAEERAEAASALARAYLYSDLPGDVRAEAALGLTAVLDDPSALVRRALAEALASAADAPHHIVLALACDQSEVASVVLARSPALADAELVDCAALGDALAQAALARRPRLAAGVCAALAEIGCREAILALIDNLEADLPAGALWRIFERFGADAEMREALLSRAWLPPALRNELAAATARALAEFAARCDWLSEQRAERIVREAREQATVTIACSSAGEELAELVRRMRSGETLTVAVLMRALLCGDRAFFVQAIVELTGQSERRVAGFARSPASHGFAALYGKARLPSAFLPAFRAALGGLPGAAAPRGDKLSRALAERAIAACEARGGPAVEPIRALLWRLAAEAARDDAREFAGEAARYEPPLRAIEPAEALSYAPLLIDAVAAALEDFVAATLEDLEAPPALVVITEESAGAEAPRIEAPVFWREADDEWAPPVQLAPDMLAALADAA